MKSTELERWFPGPEGKLYFKKYLYSCSEEKGTTVWDVEIGERLLLDENLKPIEYHAHQNYFLSILSNGDFQVSKIVSDIS